MKESGQDIDIEKDSYKYEVLHDVFGLQAFREGQEGMVDALLKGRDVLGIMPTGGGKSLCYQLPSMMMEGMTIVISPLISLMQDQVAALRQLGIRAAYLNSSLNYSEYQEVLEGIRRGTYRLVYLAPERLENEEFMEIVLNTSISMVTVDEAHCISQWGHNFRPSYLKIPDFIAKLPNRPVISAFTATATKQVKLDIQKLLKLKKPYIRITGFDRNNLYFHVEQPEDKFEATYNYVHKNMDRSGIIYCSTRKNVEEVHRRLNERDIGATRYHAGLSEKERQINQREFIYDRSTVMVATNAFGMGIDKSNVSYVIHYNMPKNMESYYQEAGRAGRDGEPAECLLFYSGQDVRVNRFLIEKSEINRPGEEKLPDHVVKKIKDKELELLKKMTFYCFTRQCLRQNLLSYFGEKAHDYCGNCSNCRSVSITKDITVDAQKIISAILRTQQECSEEELNSIVRGQKTKTIQEKQWDKLSTFGLLDGLSRDDVEDRISFLRSKGYLTILDEGKLTVKVRKKSMIVLRGEKKLEMPIRKEQDLSLFEQMKKRWKKEGGLTNINKPLDQEMFTRLKELRNRYAKEEDVPSYIIFPDTTLKEMIRKAPKTLEELQRINGVGKAKLEKYGVAFLRLLQQ